MEHVERRATYSAAMVERLIIRLLEKDECSCSKCGGLAVWARCSKIGHEEDCYALVCIPRNCKMEDMDCTTDE
jgi:hypothetical protein